MSEEIKEIKEMQTNMAGEMKNTLEQTKNEMISQIKVLKDESKREITEMLELFTTELEQTNARVDVIDKTIQGEIVMLKTNITEEIKEIKENISGEINNRVNPIQDKIINIEQEMTQFKNNSRVQDRIQVVVAPSMFKNEVESKFGGDIRAINPKNFMKSLREQIDTVSDLDQVKKLIRSALKGDAETWFSIQEQNFENLDEFEIIFLNYYWGEQTQSKVREGLFFGKYEEKYGVPREKYAMRKYTVAKLLDPPIANGDIIKYISRHFDDDIRNVVAINDIRSIDRLLEYLRRIDDIKRPKYQNFNNRREVGCTEYNNNSGRSTQEHQRNNNNNSNYQNDRRNAKYGRKYEDNQRRYENNDRVNENYKRRNENGDNYRRNENYNTGYGNYERNNYYRQNQERRDYENKNRYENNGIRTNGNMNREERNNNQGYGTRQNQNWRKEEEIQTAREPNNNNKNTGQGNNVESRNRNVNTIVKVQENAQIYANADENQDF